MEEYLTVSELSARIKMAEGTIRNLVYQKKFKERVHYVKPTPRKLLFIWSQVEQWLLGSVSGSSNRTEVGNQENGLIQI
jgi:hypothetical protein